MAPSIDPIQSKATSTLIPNALSHPPKSFIDAVIDQRDSQPSIHVKPMSLHRGEPAVIFSKEEILVMAAPFKLSLIGKFSFGRPTMEVIRKFFVSLGLKGNSQISLFDNRHVLIKLNLEEDYTRLWLRQSWVINGRSMRMFKWSTNFRCAEESPIVPIWISLPCLPIHFVNCKPALYSIAAAVGKPLRVDQATASGNRPSVARVLVEYDISKELLPRVWVGEGNEGFWQHIIFEKVPSFCSSCKHLGHDIQNCYIFNPQLRAEVRNKHLTQMTGRQDKRKQIAENTHEASRDVGKSQYIAKDILKSPGNIGEEGIGFTEQDLMIKKTGTVARVVAIPDEDVLNTLATAHHVPSVAADIIAIVDPVIGEKAASNTIPFPSQNVQSEVCMAVERVLDSSANRGSWQDLITYHQEETRASTSARRMTGSAAMTEKPDMNSKIDEAEREIFATADVGLNAPLSRTEPNSFSEHDCPIEQQTDGPMPNSCTKPTHEVESQHNLEPISRLDQQRDDSISHVEVEHSLNPNLGHQPMFQLILDKLQSPLQTTKAGAASNLDNEESSLVTGPTTHLNPSAQAQQPSIDSPKAIDQVENIGLINQVRAPAQFVFESPKHAAAIDSLTEVGELDLGLSKNHANVKILEHAIHGSGLGKSSGLDLASREGITKLVNDEGMPVSQETINTEPNSTSFQAGNLISYNPNPTVVIVDSLPIPRPAYVSDDYITDCTVEEPDSDFMPDYSLVGFNTHSDIIPDDFYYGSVGHSHSLDDRVSLEADFRIDARCGVSDSAIDKRIKTDADGFTKVTPRKTRQYHLRPRNRRR